MLPRFQQFTMSKTPLSVFMIAKNEADRIGRALQAVATLSDDIVVVDSGSTDGTQDGARRHGARVIHNDWPGYGPQKRFAEDQCRHDWLFNIDADEIVTPALAAEIQALFNAGDPKCDAYTVAIAEIFPGESEPHALAYALKPVRLYRKSKQRYANSTVHDRVELSVGANVSALQGIIHHFSIRSIGDQISKLNAYTDQQVLDLAARGKSFSSMRLFVEFPAAFLKAYVFRRHFLRGRYGFITAMNFAFYRWLRVAKDAERHLTQGSQDKGK